MTDTELYNAAKEAYYNGTPIMEDFEFDELEKKLGLENKSYVGAKHNPSYTVKHPFMMGSLSKVQIHEKDGKIDWSDYFAQVAAYIYRNRKGKVIITPKFDGCSYEMTCQMVNGVLVIKSISSRGDGAFGKDQRKHLERKFQDQLILPDDREYTIRGEVLINKQVFYDKYSEFVNPRSFVSGILNRDYDANDPEFVQMVDDLSVVIYDVRVLNDGVWEDTDWTRYKLPYLPDFYKVRADFDSEKDLSDIYDLFDNYRAKCPYALDGIVIKPTDDYRTNNLTEHRPKDCIAIKFIPQLQETEVVDIEWGMGKTNELHPVIVVKPVTMDGKQVSRASAHNYGFMIDNKVSIGTKVILSLAGDIIPFIYKITNTDNYDQTKMNLPTTGTYTEGCHMYKMLTDDEITEMKFIQSAEALKIPNIGPAAAQKIFDYMVENCKGDDFLCIEAKRVPNNILCCSSADIANGIGGKSGASAAKAFDTFVKDMSLSDVIRSCTFDICGKSVADAIQRYIVFGNDDFGSLPSRGYQWCLDSNSDEMNQLCYVLENCGKSLEVFKQELQFAQEQKIEQTPIIMTGEPTTAATKDEFLRQHPEYRETSSWKEVKIVFTNSLDSNTGKMKKAREKGIEIQLY